MFFHKKEEDDDLKRYYEERKKKEQAQKDLENLNDGKYSYSHDRFYETDNSNLYAKATKNNSQKNNVSKHFKPQVFLVVVSCIVLYIAFQFVVSVSMRNRMRNWIDEAPDYNDENYITEDDDFDFDDFDFDDFDYDYDDYESYGDADYDGTDYDSYGTEDFKMVVSEYKIQQQNNGSKAFVVGYLDGSVYAGQKIQVDGVNCELLEIKVVSDEQIYSVNQAMNAYIGLLIKLPAGVSISEGSVIKNVYDEA